MEILLYLQIPAPLFTTEKNMPAVMFEGSRLSRSIDNTNIEDIKNVKTLAKTIAWDKIKDWFCDTHIDKAKVALYDLYCGTSDDVQLAGFNTLYTLVAATFRCEFDYEVRNESSVEIAIGKIGISQTFQLPTDTPTAEIVDSIKTVRADQDAEECLAQLETDAHRLSLCFHNNGETYRYSPEDGVDSKLKKESVKKFADECTLYQQRWLGMLASQMGILDLIGISNKHDPSVVSAANKDNRDINIYRLPSGHIRVDIFYKTDFPLDEAGDTTWLNMKTQLNAYDTFTLTATFIIGPDHTVCLQADCKGEHWGAAVKTECSSRASSQGIDWAGIFRWPR
ncbi:hypothetical protein [Pseudomonas fluorescens]|uniref:Uncharacterized protein n=1 Tax=Pseudomonas fluorescens TaxID=294 RepID=A0A5E7IRV6_PSEFL|nr:hypothetical protein [Pseudomonas fluorescens]VVO79215.1 hypothetical protein PS880_01709 [Pseudomonas fluorescens]